MCGMRARGTGSAAPLICRRRRRRGAAAAAAGSPLVAAAPVTPDMPRHDRENSYMGSSCAAAWARRWWRALMAEACATALLVWLGVGSLVAHGRVGPEAPLSHVAQGFGCIVIGCLMAFGPTSGAHMNPAVTLAAVLSGVLGAAPALGYALAQLAGATLGYAALMGTMAPSEGLGVTQPAPAVGVAEAALLEAGLTGLLALVCCALWAAPHPDPAAPVKVGLVIVGLVYAGGASTGASLNPARSFGPALLLGQWEAQWVYWVGPLGGAAAAALLHRYVLQPAPAPARPAEPEDLPLGDKP